MRLRNQKKGLDLCPTYGELTRALVIRYLRKNELQLLTGETAVDQSSYFSAPFKDQVPLLIPFALEKLNRVYPIFDEYFFTVYVSGEPTTAWDETRFEQKIGQVMASARWATVLVDRDVPSSLKLAKAFLIELGAECLSHHPPANLNHPYVKAVMTLYRFYSSACRHDVCIYRSYTPEIIAQALHQLLKEKGSLHALVEAYGESLSWKIFNDQETQFLSLCEELTCKALAKRRKEQTEKEAEQSKNPELSGFVSLLRRDPFRVFSNLLPPFLERLFPVGSFDRSSLETNLLPLAPLCTPLLRTEEFEESVRSNAATIQLVIKASMITSSQQHSHVLDLIRTLLHNEFAVSVSTGEMAESFARGLVDAAVQANALFMGKGGDEKALEELEMEPLQHWFIIGLKGLLKGSSILDTVAWVNTKLLSYAGRPGRYVKNKALEALLFYYLKKSSQLSGEEKSALMENQPLLKSLEKLTELLMELIPLWKNNHETAFYFQKLDELNRMIRNKLPLDRKKATEIIHAIAMHFFEKDFVKYEGPLLAALEVIPTLLQPPRLVEKA